MRYSKYILSDATSGEREVSGKTYIYFLLDPDDGRVRYVGKTKSPRTRYHGYMSKASRGEDAHLPVNRWISKLLLSSHYPTMQLAELVLDEIWEEREKYWISFHRAQDLRLLNILPGGGGTSGFSRPERVKTRISQTLTGHVVTEDTREKLSKAQTGRSYSLETRQKVSEAGRRRWAALTPEAKAAHLASKRKPVWTPEMRAALSAKKAETAPRADGSVPGVRFNPKTGKWQAQVRRDGRNVHLGSFVTKELAALARQAAQ